MSQRFLGALALGAALIAQTALLPAQDEHGMVPLHNLTLLDDRLSEQGFLRIFNGKDLVGWEGNPKLWSAKNGAITGQTTAENPIKGNTFLIWTNGTLADFELRCSFRLVPGDAKGFANSGIQFRSRVVDATNWVVHGYQADMSADHPNYTGMLYEEGMRGILALCGEKVLFNREGKKERLGSVGDAAQTLADLKKDGWNDYVVVGRGNHLMQFVNGRQTIDLRDEFAAKRALTGVLALQLHAGPPMTVQFKNLYLKKL